MTSTVAIPQPRRVPALPPSGRVAAVVARAAELPAPQARTLMRDLHGAVCAAHVARNAQAAAYFAEREPWIKQMHAGLAALLRRAEKETLATLRDKKQTGRISARADGVQAACTGGASVSAAGVGFDFIFDRRAFSRGFMAVLRTATEAVLQAAGEELYNEIGRDDPWTMPAPAALRYLDERKNLLQGIPDEIHREIEGEIKEGMANGESLRELSKRISGKFAEIEEGRATTIASTETGCAYGFARQESMRSAGVRHKRWLTSHLPNVRWAHSVAEEENQLVPIDQPFIVGGEELMFPGDPEGSPENTINCHCISVTVDEGEDF